MRLLNSENIDENDLSKSYKTKIRIIEGALDYFSTYGLEKASFTNLAQHISVSRPLITHYFPRKEILFEQTIEYIANYASTYIEQESETLSKKNSSPLEVYLKSNINWAKNHPSHFKVWILFLYKCSFNHEYKEINKQVKEKARLRIQEILKKEIKLGNMSISNTSLISSMIHDILYSNTISALTETDEDFDYRYKKIKKMINLII